jgi:predicted MFS family arabinose efflux permease
MQLAPGRFTYGSILMRLRNTEGNKLISARAELWMLALGNFAVATGIMAIPGMLNELSADLAVPPALIGTAIFVFALAVSIGGPPLSSWTSNINRRTLLTGALSLYALAHFAAVFIPGYIVFVTTRVLAAAGAALFTGQAPVIIAAMVPKEIRGKAIGFVFLGAPAAAVIGKPLSSYLGASIGSGVPLAIIGVLSGIAAVGVWRTIPKDIPVTSVDPAAWKSLLADAPLLMTIVATWLQAVGAYAVLSYKAWLLKELINATPTIISLLFLCFGVAGVVGNIFAAMTMDRIGPVAIGTIGMGSTLIAIALLPLSRGSLGMSVILTAIWGLGAFAVNGAQQVRVIAMAPALASIASATCYSAVFLGQAIGTLLGGFMLSSHGIEGLCACGTAFVAIAMVLSLSIWAVTR